MKHIRNILVYSLVNLGDVVLATSAVALLKKIRPDVKVTMMVRPFARQIVENNPIVDDVLVFDYKAKGKSFRRMCAMIREIRNANFDMSISLDRKLRPALLCFLAGIPIRLGADRLFDDKPSRIPWLYTDVMKMPADFLNTHQADLFQGILRQYFSSADRSKPQIAQITDTHREKAKRLLADLPQAKHIALCVRGTYYSKNWPQEKFAELISRLAVDFAADFYIVGAPDDYSYAQKVIECSPVRVWNFCGQTDLLDLAALMEQTDLLITIDTGGMHIAATTGIPIVGIYRCVSENRWKALSEDFEAVSYHRADCPKQMKNPECCPGHYCVKDIEVDKVYQAAVKLLRRAGSAR